MPHRRFYRIGQMAGRRLIELSRTVHVEPAEITSIIGLTAQFAVIAFNPRFISGSTYLSPAEDHVPRWLFLLVLGGVAFGQFTGVLLGGMPSAVIGSRREFERWLTYRRVCLFAGIIVWAILARLSSLVTITPSALTCAACSLYCGWGAWRLRVAAMTEEELRRLRDLEATVEEMAQSGQAVDTGTPRGGRDRGSVPPVGAAPHLTQSASRVEARRG